MNETTSARDSLDLDDLAEAVKGDTSAIRVVTRLEPAGGAGDKVFPPTYQGGDLRDEKAPHRRHGRRRRRLDSVQSQANRMELALRAARERGELRFPPIVADFSREFPHIGRITALDAPHRIADAIFRESLRNGKPFRDSEEGQCFAYATARNARAGSSLCGPRSTLQQRFAFLPLPQGHGSFRPTFAT